MLTQSYNLNVVPDQRIGTVTVNASQYDKTSRTIRFTMYNGEVPFQIPADSNVYVIGTKADNTGYQYECEYVANSNVVTFDIQPQMTVLPGFHTAEIRVTKDGEILGSANFRFQIERGALSDDTIISDTDLPLVEKAAEAVDALEDVTDAIEEANAILSQIDPIAEAVQANALKSEGYAIGEQDGTPVSSDSPYYHNNAKYYNIEASTSASNAHTSELNASGSASTASTKAGEASASALSASNSATTATNKANEASNSATTASTKANEASTSATTASNKAGEASTSATNAANSASSASTNALKSEGFAVGQQNGTDVSSGSPYYENNSKYYFEQAESIKEEMADLLDNVAMQDGYYQNMTVGNAEQLVSNMSITDSAPYVFRTSGGSVDIGNREEDMIVGGSFAWNQLLKEINSTNWSVNNASASFSDGVCTFTGSAVSPYVQCATPYKATVGHKYLYSCRVKGTNGANLRLRMNGGYDYKTFVGTGNWETISGIFSASGSSNGWSVWDNRTSGWDEVQFEKYMAFNLTQMFGSTIADYLYNLEQSNAGSGVALAKKWGNIVKPYYAYNVGEMKSVSGLTSHDMVGFNAWDEEWETGTIDVNTGADVSGSNNIRSANYVCVLPSTVYYGKTNEKGMRVICYDADKNFISNIATFFDSTFTTPQNCYYIRFFMGTAYGTTYKNDICINLHWDGERDGEYEPYTKNSYPLDSSVVLRGVPKLDSSNNMYYDGDTYESDGTVNRRYTEIDLSSLTWGYDSGNTRFVSDPLSGVVGASVNNIANIVCTRYVPSSYVQTSNSANNMIIALFTTGNIAVRDSQYSDSVSFKNSLSGVKIVCELATPTTESAEPFQSPQVVDNWGTEEYVGAEITVGHVTKYPANLVDKLESAPESPSGDGVYLMKQENGINTYIQYLGELPSAPSSDGNYVLKCTVSSGTASYTWGSES